MNSMPNDRFDEQLDSMLAASVRPGAEPQSLIIPRMPEKPRFNWVLAGGLAALIVTAVTLMVVWVAARLFATSGPAATLGDDLNVLLTDAIIIGTEALTSTTSLVYIAIAVACLYVFAASRFVRHCRHH